MKHILSRRLTWVTIVALSLTIGLAVVTSLNNNAQLDGLLLAAWGFLLALFILGTFLLGFLFIRKIFASTKFVERLIKELNAETINSRKQLRVVNSKIADIAGSVGRTAPLVREVHKNIENLTAMSQELSVGGGERAANQTESEVNSAIKPLPIVGLDSQIERFINSREVHMMDPALSTPYWDVPVDGAHFVLQVGMNEAISLELISCSISVSSEALKSSLLCARAFDKDGDPLDHKVLKTAHEKFGSYSYIHSVNTNRQIFQLSLPAAATSVEVSIYPWKEKQALSNSVTILRRHPNPKWAESRHVSQIRVATILDEFSFNSFSPEFTAVTITPANWLARFEEEKPDLFFCESAWSGEDSELRPWKGKIYASENFSKENRTTLLEILDYCALNGIPTVFWNKEDPTHYTDRKHDFVKTAILFDHVFTTDKESASQYRTDYGHKSVHVLPFAVQPRLFNPISTIQRSDDVVFAGSWYANHVERSVNMKTMFDAALSSGHQLKIYDRYFHDDDPLHVFPEEYRKFLVPPVPHSEVSKVYKESTIGMTINTVTASETMFARRIFELMACNTLVVSNHSVGVEKMFGSDVLFLDQDKDALKGLDRLSSEEIRARNTRKVLMHHTYAQRFISILDVAGIEFSKTHDLPTIVRRINSIHQARVAWESLRQVDYPVKKKVILIGSELAATEAAEIVQDFNVNGITVVDERLVLSAGISCEEAFGERAKILLMVSGDSNISFDQIMELDAHSTYVDVPIRFGSSEQRYKFERFEGIVDGLYSTENLFTALTAWSKSKKYLLYSV